MESNYYRKYLKYKTKFIILKGGSNPHVDFDKLTPDDIKLLKEYGANNSDKLESIKLLEEHKQLLTNIGLYAALKKPIRPYDELLNIIKSVKLTNENIELFKKFQPQGSFSEPYDKVVDRIESMKLMKANPILEEYNVYKKGGIIPSTDTLMDKLKSIKLIEEHRASLQEYNLYAAYKKSMPSDSTLKSDLDLIKAIESEKALLQEYNLYNIYKEYFPSVGNFEHNLQLIKTIKSHERLLQEYNLYDKFKGSVMEFYKPMIEYELENTLKIIKIIEDNKPLLRKYNLYDIYKKSLPTQEQLEDKLESVKFMQEHIASFEGFGENQIFDGPNLPPLSVLSKLLLLSKIVTVHPELKKYDVFKYSERLDDDFISDKVRSIKLIESTPELSQYGVFKLGNEIPPYNILFDRVQSIKLIKAHPESGKFTIYKKGDIIPPYRDLYDKLKIIEDNSKLLEEYELYKENDTVPNIDKMIEQLQSIEIIKNNPDLFGKDVHIPLDDVKNYYIDKKYPELRKYKDKKMQSFTEISKDGETIELIRRNPILNEHFGYKQNHITKNFDLKPIDQVKHDIDTINNISNDCMKPPYPAKFYISGLRTFSVYKHEQLNKIIYLLGEHHNMDDICTQENPIYTADDFFFSLLNCASPEYKLDVFLEMNYDPRNTTKFFREHDLDKSFMMVAITNLYKQYCKPSSIKLQLKENKICKYDHYVRFHHADLRHAADNFVNYLGGWYWYFFGSDEGYDNSDEHNAFLNKYQSYDRNTLLKAFETSIFIPKIRKQIDNILDAGVRRTFSGYFDGILANIRAPIMNNIITFDKINKLPIDNFDRTLPNYIRINYLAIMDMYLMTRLFRHFDQSYTATNSIIYTGNAHIQNYEDILYELGFKKHHKFTNINKHRESCLEITGFNLEYLQCIP